MNTHLSAWTPIIGAVLSAIGVGLVNLFATNRASGRTEGAITTAIKAIKERMDRKDADNEARFEKIEKNDDEQWSVIRQTQHDVGYLQGRANGKAH